MPFKNDVIEFTSGIRARVLQIVHTEDLLWIVRLGNLTELPRPHSLSLLREMLLRGEAKVVAPEAPVLWGEMSRTEREVVERRLSIIRGLTDDPSIFIPAARKHLIAERAAQMNCAQNTVYLALRKWWQGGQTRDALRNRRPTKPTEPDNGGSSLTRQRGRKPSVSLYAGPYQVTNDDIRKIKSALQNHYLKGELSTWVSTYNNLIDTQYAYVDGDGVSNRRPQGEVPSFRQFKYYARKTLSLETILRRKRGDKKFDMNHSPRLSTIYVWSAHVGEVYEIDATIADVLIVARSDRSRIIGKPTLYLIYDRKSRLCPGFLLTLEPASWAGAMEAMLSLANDWASVCARHNVPYSAADWPAQGLFPASFVGDRGEMASKDSSSIASGLASTVTNTPALAPQGKGTVELGFRLIQQSLAPDTPGYMPPGHEQRRRGPKYDKDACLTLDELEKIILEAAIAHNKSLMERYPLRPDEVARGVPP